MKAIVYTRYGGPEVLQLKEIDQPVPNDNEVLVKVHAVSINDWDWGLIEGKGLLTRLMSGLFKPSKKILGSDIAGTVESVGRDIKKFKPGDKVFGDLSGQWGGFAEYVCAQEKALAFIPGKMNFIEAAAIPQAGMLAVQGLRDTGKIKSGQKILINGAGGGVGSFAIQIARLYDVEVTGVDNASKLDMMLSLGFDHVIDYEKEDFTKNGKRYDLILDTKTNRSVFAYSRALKDAGVYATVGGSIGRLLVVLILSPLVTMFSKKKFRVVAFKANKDLGYFADLYEAGKLKVVIDGPYKLEEISRAFTIFSKGAHKGKMVIRVTN